MAPTYMNGGEDPKKSKLRKQVMPSPDARKPKKAPVKSELTPEQMAVVSRSHQAKAAVQQAKSKGVSEYNMPKLVERMKSTSDSATAIMQNAWSPKKKK